MTVNILGTKYTVTETTPEKDVCLCNYDGYCDKTTKQIVITKQTPDSEIWAIFPRIGARYYDMR